jgi:hypothetical protein
MNTKSSTQSAIRTCPLCGATDLEGHDREVMHYHPDGVEVSGEIIFCPLFGPVDSAPQPNTTPQRLT